MAKEANNAFNDRFALFLRQPPKAQARANGRDESPDRQRKLPIAPLPALSDMLADMGIAPPPPSSPPPPEPTGRGHRHVVLSARVRDGMPDATDFRTFLQVATRPVTPPRLRTPPLVDDDPPSEHEYPELEPSAEPRLAPMSSIELPDRASIPEAARWTRPNAFQMYRYYRREPSYVPDSHLEFQSAMTTHGDRAVVQLATTIEAAIHPYPNLTTWLFDFEFFVNGDGRSYNSWEHLQRCITRKDFRTVDLEGQNLEKIRRRVTSGSGVAPWLSAEQWTDSTLVVRIPGHEKETAARKKAAQNAAAREHRQAEQEGLQDESDDEETEPGYPLPVPGMYHQSICSAVRRFFEAHPLGKVLHMHGFSLLRVPVSEPTPGEDWRPNPAGDILVWGEVYTSERFLRYEEELLVSRENGTHPMAAKCKLPWIVCSLMFWSDATQLAAFSDTKAWPIYMFIGNLSKYFRLKPSSKSGIIMAYIPSMPKYTKEFIAATRDGAPMPAPLKAHLQRELAAAVWGKMLTEEFIDAYLNGMVMKCVADGQDRRAFLRIVSYSMDYPEKMLMTSTRDLGTFPFPRVELTLAAARWLGTQRDKDARRDFKRVDSDEQQEAIAAARKLIYEQHYAVNTKKVEDILKDHSWTPTVNAFSAALRKHGFNYYDMVVVDLMHEFEIGVWKAIFLHLLRIIVAYGNVNALQVLDLFFKAMPAHGQDAIGKMGYNVSDLSRPTARVFKDILLDSIPPLEGRLDAEDNELVMDMLYVICYWFSLAKMHMHDKISHEVFGWATAELGIQLRRFADVLCKKWDEATKETPKEAQKRARNTQSRAKKAGKPCTSDTAARPKKFNLNTVKLQALGDYADHIPELGTLDSYDSKIGEVLHQIVKAWWRRASNYQATGQMVNIGIMTDMFIRQAEVLRHLGVEIHDARKRCGELPPPEEPVDPARHHTVPKDKRNYITIPVFLRENYHDVATKSFSHDLRTFLYRQLAAQPETDAISPQVMNAIIIENQRLYNPATFSVYYTTYDCQRRRDVVNPKHDRRNILVYTPLLDGDRGTHPWRYARVLRVFHAQVSLTAAHEPQRVEFAWVRWFETDHTQPFGARALRLERIRYVPDNQHGAFGFIDLADVIREIQIMPATHYGIDTLQRSGPSMARDTKTGDYRFHYVGRFCDPDIAVRFLGIGIGHLKLQATEMDAIPMPSEARMGTPPDDVYGGQSAAGGVRNANEDDEVEYDELGVRRSGIVLEDEDSVAGDSDSDHEHLPSQGTTNEDAVANAYG